MSNIIEFDISKSSQKQKPPSNKGEEGKYNDNSKEIIYSYKHREIKNEPKNIKKISSKIYIENVEDSKNSNISKDPFNKYDNYNNFDCKYENNNKENNNLDDKYEENISKVINNLDGKYKDYSIKINNDNNISNNNEKNNNFDDKSEHSNENPEKKNNDIDEINIYIFEEKEEFTLNEKIPLIKEINFESCFFCFFEYFKKREIFCIAFFNSDSTTPKFIRKSIFMLSLSVIFTINCFFFDDSLVHERYLNTLNGKNNNISYLFKKEFKISIYTAIINNAIIMIFIKFIINWIFNITDKEIAMLDNSFEKGLSPKEKKIFKNSKG